jgi:hypothetical protein
MSKCEFGKTYVFYFGYIVEGSQFKIDPSKIETIMKWPKPNNVIEVRSFLGEFNIGGSPSLTFLLLHLLYIL